MFKHHMLSQVTSFVGRTQEITDISASLSNENCRLLTLVGAGGIGKTRLALEVASQKLSEFPNGVYFVPLQPLIASEYVVSAIIDALELSLSVQEPPHIQLFNYLRSKSILLILDNMEHLLSDTDLIQQMLKQAPQLKLLVTSREALNLREEWLYPLKGLHYPVNKDTEDAEAYSAIQLFVDCARRLRPDFRFTEHQAEVIRICQLVEGMPLALELAATWIKVLPCSEIVTQIQHGLDFLATNQSNMPTGHQSIQAVFDHSWELLKEEEQTIFKKLAVFRDGFQYDAVKHVTDASPAAIRALVDKSMLRLEISGRYNIHELLRQYAEEKLNEIPEIKDMALNRHGQYYAQFLSQRESSLESDQQRQALKEILVEINNIRAAWNHNVKGEKVEQIGQSLQSLIWFYKAYAWYQEGVDMFASATTMLLSIRQGETTGVLQGRLLTAQGICHNWLGQVDQAKALFREGLGLVRSHGSEVDKMRTLNEVGIATYHQGDFRQAQEWFQESLSIAPTTSASILLASNYHYLCSTYLTLGEYKLAKQAGEESLKNYQQLGQMSGLFTIMTTMGALFLTFGHYQEAKQILQQGITIAENDWSHNRSRYLETFGGLNHALGEYDQARQQVKASLALAREINIPRRITWSLWRLGDLECTLGNYAVAHQHYLEAIHIASEAGQTWQQLLGQRGLGRVTYYRGDYVEARRLQQDNLTLCRSLDSRLEMAKVLKELGLIASALKDKSEARRYFYDALQTGHLIENLPIILAILSAIAELFMIEEKYGLVAKLLTICLHHPASHADTRQHARQLLDRLQAEFPLETSTQTQQAIPVSELDLVITEVLNLLAPHTQVSHPLMMDSLTSRELEILRLLAVRRTNKEIADELFISVGTVKTHVHNICSKFGVSRRHDAVERAQKLRLL